MIQWTKTTEEVYNAIQKAHSPRFKVFGSFTNMESNSRLGNPKILTEWGFVGADHPLIRAVDTKDSDESEWQCGYYLWAGVCDKEGE